MNQGIQALSSLTQLTPYASHIDSETSVAIHDVNFNNLVSNAFNKISETTTQYKDIINSLSHSEHFSSDPKTLLMLQSYIGEYSNYVSLVSALARKGVATIETLEKSQ
ncbi:type III secretion system inner rod subunit SctI [Citrobacter sp. JGM124]|uniref:type III secretion system inner rod subunit SctI n=1 Tax=Citrobacter sp. JGM124 TaxID=2799789 RepID=UPI001BAB2D36|nr:type III secretion system inner rod subunit SctI [Citrobacter sp. JGM124]MBS0846913.1 type III secretion system inner rod subunit SctI [Citrobacter sp. JGM124]